MTVILQQYATEFVASYIETWNQHDASGLASHLTEHGIYCDVPLQTQTNREQLIANLDEFFIDDPYYYHLFGEVLTGETTIAFQYRVTARNGELENEWFGAEFITMQGDAAGNITDFYQQADFVGAASQTHVEVMVKRYAKSGLDASHIRLLAQQLKQFMDESKPYLDGNLTLPQLAEALDCSVNHLSQVINSEIGLGFFDFINGYRVRDAIELLSSTVTPEQAVLNIALAAGFNSTSTFYAAFKKHTGQTPTRYRKAHPMDEGSKSGRPRPGH